MKAYRYILEPYKGRKTRHTCPQCEKAQIFTRYIDTETGERLPDQYGRCNRQNNCGYHLNPYKDGYVSQIQKIQQGSLPKTFQPIPRKFIKTPAPAKSQTIFIPDEIFQQSLCWYEQNHFAQYLISLFGNVKAEELIKRFHLGTSRFWQGANIFWIIDPLGRIAGGQVVLFDLDGHTHKEPNKRFNSWVHTALKARYQNDGLPVPTWLKSYAQDSPKFPCLFGLPQLKNESPTKLLAIVEAPKTAIIATGYFPQFIWLAVGSLSYLNEGRLTCIRGRKVVLFPDKGGYERWSNKTTELGTLARFTVSDLLERKKTIEGSDLADYLTLYPPDVFALDNT